MKFDEKTIEMVNLSGLSSFEATDFIRTYLLVLTQNIISYVDSDITLGPVDCVQEYSADTELSQEITGMPGAYSAIDGPEDALIAFAKAYSKMDVDSFDDFAKEVLLDYMNLHNGLFVVHLSNENICELSLDVPINSTNKTLSAMRPPGIIVVPITFRFGTIKFILGELS